MNLLLIDQPIRNRGDESAHKALVRRLLQADPSWIITVPYRYDTAAMEPMMVFDQRVRYIQVKPDIFSYRLRILGQKHGLTAAWHLDPAIRKMLRLYRQADFVIASPGGINLGGFQDWKHLFFLELARYIGKPLLYFGRSVGPFPEDTPRQREFHRRAEEIISNMSFVSLRDRRSDAYVPGAVRTLDSAFLESPSADLPEMPAGPYVVFVPNELSWHYAFRNVDPKTIRAFYSSIAERIHANYPGHRIVYLPQLYAGTVPVEHDRDYFLSLCTGEDFVAPETWSSDVQQQVIRGASCMVGARYHSVVFAINNAVPFVALSYEHKIAGLCESLGFDYIDISHAFDGTADMLSEIDAALQHPQSDKEKTDEAKRIAEDGFQAFLDHISGNPSISVIVPNYNYASYLEQRMDSIFAQTVKPKEVIVLDDASTDNSLEVLEKYKGRIRLIVNEVNGGSPFPQWKKGMEAATGSLVWIAESDDFSDASFLEKAVQAFKTDPSCTLSFVRSMLTDSDGADSGIHPNQAGMDKSFSMKGKDFIPRYLAEKNTIVNASSALFSRKAALGINNGYQDFGGSGDVLFWTGIAKNGNVHYDPSPLNHFRQHGSNRTKEDSINGRGEKEALQICRYMRSQGFLSFWKQFKIKTYHYTRLRYGAEPADPELLRAWGGFFVRFFSSLKHIYRSKC